MADRSREEALEKPAGGDRWAKGERQILIHAYRDGVVFFNEITNHISMLGGGHKMGLAQFQKQVDTEEVRFLGGPNANP